MAELTPNDFEKILDAAGNIGIENLSEDEQRILTFVKLFKNFGEMSAGMRCFHCKGEGFYPPGANFICPVCKGTGIQ